MRTVADIQGEVPGWVASGRLGGSSTPPGDRQVQREEAAGWLAVAEVDCPMLRIGPGTQQESVGMVARTEEVDCPLVLGGRDLQEVVVGMGGPWKDAGRFVTSSLALVQVGRRLGSSCWRC